MKKQLVFAGLILAALAPAHGEGISVGVRVGRVSLPSFPIPVTSINRPAIQLPGPALPTVSAPRVELKTTLPSPVTVPASQLPNPVLPTVAVLPDQVIPVVVPTVVKGSVGPAQYPRPMGAEQDPLPVPVPVTVKSRLTQIKIQTAGNKLEAASAGLKAMFDNSEKPAAPAVPADDQKEGSEDTVRSERRITLPEWDLENEIGINPVDTTW
ncbi:MAG: hypothetical protein HY924_16155 [Elusimicrobia bacterium]|nr:hypothetical protein [Elusimicrobiota bacterium]